MYQLAKLCGKADIIVPNMTEAAFMLGMEYRERGEYDMSYVKEMLVTEAVREHLGARPLRRLIGRKIEDKIADIIIGGSYKNKVTIAMKDGEIICE